MSGSPRNLKPILGNFDSKQVPVFATSSRAASPSIADLSLMMFWLSTFASPEFDVVYLRFGWSVAEGACAHIAARPLLDHDQRPLSPEAPQGVPQDAQVIQSRAQSPCATSTCLFTTDQWMSAPQLYDKVTHLFSCFRLSAKYARCPSKSQH